MGKILKLLSMMACRVCAKEADRAFDGVG